MRLLRRAASTPPAPNSHPVLYKSIPGIFDPFPLVNWCAEHGAAESGDSRFCGAFFRWKSVQHSARSRWKHHAALVAQLSQRRSQL
jgi:hypothetical protein